MRRIFLGAALALLPRCCAAAASRMAPTPGAGANLAVVPPGSLPAPAELAPDGIDAGSPPVSPPPQAGQAAAEVFAAPEVGISGSLQAVSPDLAPTIASGAGRRKRRERVIRRLLQFPFPQGPGSKSVLDEGARTIDGISYRELEGGVENEGVYAFSRDGSPRVLKVLDWREGELPEGSFDEIPRPAEEQWRWGLVGSLFGAPRLHRAGTVRGAGGVKLHFLEMEELFPDSGGRSLKTIHGPGLTSLLERRPDGRRPTQDIADLFTEVLEYGIVPKDSDFFLARDGRLAWIDAQRWYRDRDNQFPSELGEAARQAWNLLFRLETAPKVYKAYYLDFLTALKGSMVLNEKFKERFLRGVFKKKYPAARGVYDSLP